jgi:hypothetical protein
MCYKCVAVILRYLPKTHVTDAHVRLLISFIRAEVRPTVLLV